MCPQNQSLFMEGLILKGLPELLTQLPVQNHASTLENPYLIILAFPPYVALALSSYLKASFV